MSSNSGRPPLITTVTQAPLGPIGRYDFMQMPTISPTQHIDALRTSYLLSAFSVAPATFRPGKKPSHPQASHVPKPLATNEPLPSSQLPATSPGNIHSNNNNHFPSSNSQAHTAAVERTHGDQEVAFSFGVCFFSRR